MMKIFFAVLVAVALIALTGAAAAARDGTTPKLNSNTDWSQFKRDEEYYRSLENKGTPLDEVDWSRFTLIEEKKEDEIRRRWGSISTGHAVFYGILILLALSAYALIKELINKQSTDMRRAAVLFAGTAALSISAVLAMNGRYVPVVSHNRYIASAVLDQWTGDTCFVMKGGYFCISEK